LPSFPTRRSSDLDDPALDGLPQSVLRAEVVGDEPDGHPRLGGDGAQGSAGEAVGREEVEAGIADAGATGEVPSAVVRGLLAVAATLRSDTILRAVAVLCSDAALRSVLGSCRCHVLSPAFPKRPCSCSCACRLVRMPARAHAGSCACLLLPALEDRLGPIVPGQFFHARARRWHLPARGRCTVLTRRDTIEHSFSILYIRSEPVICAGLRGFEPPARP